MVINELVLTLAGFVLAHAAWNTADLPAGQRLAPFVVVQQNGERELTRFEGRKQAEAVSDAKEFLKQAEEKADAWAMARQGIVTIDGQERDVLIVEYWSPGMAEPYTIMQKFRPPARRVGFKIIGRPFVFIDGEIQDSSDAEDMVNIVETGIQEHTQAGPSWTKWENEY